MAHMGVDISTLHVILQFSFDLSQSYKDVVYPMVECMCSLFLAIGHVLKILWPFEILTWESMGKSQNLQYLENG